MNVRDVEERIEAIRASRFDDEAAHSMEDELHREVLACIALGGTDDPKALADAALVSTDIEFSRWMA